jgi:hypothetical protein
MPELSHIDPGSAALLVMDYQVDTLTRFMTAAQSADAIACVPDLIATAGASADHLRRGPRRILRQQAATSWHGSGPASPTCPPSGLGNPRCSDFLRRLVSDSIETTCREADLI